MSDNRPPATRHTPDSPVKDLQVGSPEHLALLRARTRTEGSHDGYDWSITSGIDPDPGHYYPKVDCHVWGAFAGVAIEADGKAVAAVELGGYNDLEVVDPYNGRRLWIGSAFRGKDTSIYTAMRRMIDVMEATRFLNPPADAS